MTMLSHESECFKCRFQWNENIHDSETYKKRNRVRDQTFMITMAQCEDKACEKYEQQDNGNNKSF